MKRRASPKTTDPVAIVIRAENHFRYEIRRYSFAGALETGPLVSSEQEARDAGALALARLKDDPIHAIVRTRF